MAAHGDATVTIDTNEMTYTDVAGLTHVVTNAQSFVCALALINSTEEVYTIKTDTLTCTDGTKLEFELDPVRSKFIVATDATAALDAGSVWFKEDSGYLAEWKIRTITIDNIDEPTAITTATLERVDNPMITMTLSAVTVAQA